MHDTGSVDDTCTKECLTAVDVPNRLPLERHFDEEIEEIVESGSLGH